MSQTCAACGGDIAQPVGVDGEFCSKLCYGTGRSFCKFCTQPLLQRTGRKEFCNDACRSRYYGTGAPIRPSILEERNRSACKTCGSQITQPKNGNVRNFCNQSCWEKYHRTAKKGLDITARWGMYAPETRKVICEVEEFMSPGAAKRLATAIDREYVLRSQGSKIKGEFTFHICKTCGKEFRRRPRGHQSKEYCSPACFPKSLGSLSEKAPYAKFTWEDIDDIRYMFVTGQMGKKDIANKYGVIPKTIERIINHRTWKPEHDPRVSRGVGMPPAQPGQQPAPAQESPFIGGGGQ